MEKIKNLRITIQRGIPNRFFIFLALIASITFYYTKYSPFLNINENQYFWILGSFVQGFSAFTGIVIASLTLGTNKLFIKRVDISEPDKMFLMPISMSIITVLTSIIGMIFYDQLNTSKILGLIIAIASIIAIWCIFEIFHLITKFISTDEK
ncbi:MAG: hypothetical protein AABX34_04690 [Nanoarchaeota archaeon]